MKKIFVSILMTLMVAAGIGMPVLAAPSEICSDELAEYAGCSGGGKDAIGGIASDIVGVVLMLIGVVAVIVAIYGGVTMMTSNGDPGKVAKGQKILIYGIVGVAVALLAYAIVYFVLKKVG